MVAGCGPQRTNFTLRQQEGVIIQTLKFTLEIRIVTEMMCLIIEHILKMLSHKLLNNGSEIQFCL
jgi:hypothetical protein